MGDVLAKLLGDEVTLGQSVWVLLPQRSSFRSQSCG